MKCTTCQAELPVGIRVCNSCGHPVYANPTLEDLYFSRLAANAPAGLVQKVRSSPFLAKERRSVTAILLTIANVEAFQKAIAEPERTPILNAALDLIAKVIYQFEGNIAKLWENTVLAFFGAPVMHEDDPLRAVHVARSILQEIQNYSKDLQTQYGVPIQVNMVLNTGPILLGDIHSNLKFDFQSLNNTLECMDLAIRKPIPRCEIILFEDTYQFVKPFVQCTPLEDLFCSAAGETLQLWRVDQVTHPGQALQRVPVNQATPLVGRQKELDLLQELSETVLAGLGRVGLILGEAGIGKSRLILEWKRSIKTLHQPTKIRWIEAHGLAFGRELAYHLLKSLLRAALGLPETATEAQVQNALQLSLADMLGVNHTNLYQYLAHLLDVQLSPEEESRIHHLSAQELRAQYLNAVKSYLKALALEQPVIILLEDLHWADESSVDLLVDLLPITTTSSILFCLVSRPERDSSGWRLVLAAREQIGPRLTEIEVNQLDEEESQSLAQALLESDTIPDKVRTMVLEKSEGNPYFIEELIRALINEGVLIQKDDRWAVLPQIDPNHIPDNLQGLLVARIDRLSPEARMTLRVASVIGRTFPERAIERVLQERSPGIVLMEQLSTLESIGMLRVAQVHPELTYTFQHILLHDAAYHSIFDEDRQNLHLIVGNVLEELYPEQQKRLASQLAKHFQEGQDPKRALKYLDVAGHVSIDSFANAEAEYYFRKAIQLTDDPESLAHLYTDLGEALSQQSKHREAIQAWNQAIQYHRELKNNNRLARVYAWSARSAWWGYDPKRSLEICLEGLQAVQDATESPDIAYLIHETGRAYLFNNQPEKARAYCEQALEMAKRLNAFDVQAEALATIGILPNVKPQQAVAALEMAVQISEEHQLFGPASRAYINLAAVIDNLGEVRLARDYRNRALELDSKTGNVTDEIPIHQAIINASLWLADFEDVEHRLNQMLQNARQNDAYLNENTLNLLSLQGLYYRYKGEFSMAIEVLTDLIDRSRQVNDLDRMAQANQVLAEITLEAHLLGDGKQTDSNMDIAYRMLTESSPAQNGARHEAVAALCVLSNIYALRGQLELAEATLNAANDLYRDQPVMQDRVQITLALARLAAANERFEDALEYLAASAQMLEKMEGRWWRARIWLEMAVTYLKRNEPEDVDQAQNLLREALSEFKELGVAYYPDLVIEKLRQVKRISRAQAIAHRKVTQELAEAGRVQNSFFPTHSPEIPGYQISGILLPAHETSGDFYDFIPLKDGSSGMVIADVGDKGAGAALYMAISRTLFRTYAGENQRSPVDVITEVNRRILSDTQQGIFLTAVYGELDREGATFQYVNAGHNPPCLLRQGKDNTLSCQNLEKTGTLMGIFKEATWEAQTLALQSRDVLILYTDGITEAQNEDGEFYGFERLLEAMQSGFGQNAEAFRNTILESIQAFTGTAPRLDDITLIVIMKE